MPAIEKKKKIHETTGDNIFNVVNTIILSVAFLVVLYPLIYILSSSFSSPQAVSSGRVVLWPVDLSLRGYEEVFSYDTVVTGFLNTFFYTIVGTCVNMIMTVLAAYPLSRKTLPGRRVLNFLFMFTMIFNGGLIPAYILNTNLGLVNTRWVMIIPLALSVYNVTICRSFFQSSIPEEMIEAAQVDGASHFRILVQLVLPLSKSVLAVLVLYYAVGHWNQYFQAFIYLSNRDLFPLQIILRDILILNSVNNQITDPQLMAAKQGMADLIKYSLIVISTGPFMLLYPFIAKHFVQGVMIGSVKG